VEDRDLKLSQFKKIDLPLHGVRLPSFEVEDKYLNKLSVNNKNISNFDFLKQLCYKGYEEKLKRGEIPSDKAEEYVERTSYELNTLDELGFTDYVLLIWDVINFCKEEDVPTGLGRGSAAGSIVLYLIGVTGLDPIKYDLFFERFVSKIRAKKQIVDGVTYLDGSLMCDVDIDICYYKRSKVLQYLDVKFAGKTSKILTLNTLSGKLLIKECGKIVASKTEPEMNAVSGMIPKVFGIVKDIEETYEEVDNFREWCDENEDAYKTALKLRNLIKNRGVHASGILLSYSDMETSCPTELSSDKSIVSSYDMNWVQLFNVKLDALGLRSVSVVDDICKQVGISIHDIDFTTPEIYQNFQDLKCRHGLFQIEADTNYKVCTKVKPKDLEELSAVLALARPGALAFVDQYSTFTNTGVSQTIHPFFEDILSSTGGVCLYQEQMMKMAHKIGFTLDEAEILRRIVGKKKIKEVKEWKKKISQKIKENKLDSEIGDVLWKILEDSANYSFNKSHSISYAALCAITTYLKFKYPQQFFLALLKMTRFEPDPIAEITKIQKELDQFGIKLLRPHLIKSKMDFCIEGNDIRFGLLSIKGISDKSINKLNDFRTESTNKFEIFQSASDCGIGLGILSCLIQAGALDGFKNSRTRTVLEAQIWSVLTQREKNWCHKIKEDFDHDLIKILKHLRSHKDEKGKVVIKESRFETILKKQKPYQEIYMQNRKNEDFANWYYENTLLGYTYGRTLKDIFRSKDPVVMNIKEAQSQRSNSGVKVVATVTEARVSKSKNGNDYLAVNLDDETGQIRAMIFNDKIQTGCRDLNNDNLPEKGSIVVVKGIIKDEECIFADYVVIQNWNIYMKLADIKS
tara:strand:+ start:1940 stop:4510 length:2571 start_codon:yes stop_codon:yes gene_type:complete